MERDGQEETPSIFERPVSRHTALGVGAGALLGLPLAGAAFASGLPSTRAARAATASRGGSMPIARPPASAAESLDPATPLTAYEYLGALYNRLVRQAPDGTMQPDLALSWEPSADAKQWTFHLRRGVTFHDGSPFTSRDAAYTLAHILDPKVGSPQGGVLASFISASRISTPDPHTLVVPLNSPNAEFPSLLMNYNCYIIPHGSAKTIGKTGIGTGPFKLKSFQPAATGVVEANLEYYEGRPNLDSITFIAISDVQARVNALLAGQVDLVAQTNLDFATAKVVQANPATTIVPDRNAYWYTMPMLATKAPFKDVRVRQAFKAAYDPKSLLQLTLQGHGAAAHNNPVPPTEPDWLPVSQGQDIQKAKSLLKAAGFPNGITISLYSSSYDANLTPLALAYKNSVAAAGINVQVVQAPSDSYYTKVWITQPFCVSYWYTGRPIDQLLNQIFRSGSGYNESLWSNPQFDKLLDAARRQIDATKRKQLYQEAQSILVQQCGDMVPLFADRLTGVSRKVQNYREYGFEFDYKNLALAT